jgi:CHASE1-domain containing sensor protein
MYKSQKYLSKDLFKILFFVIICCLTVLTLVAYFSLTTLVKAQEIKAYESATRKITDNLGENLKSSGDILYSARAFIVYNKTPTQQDWEQFFYNQHIFEDAAVDGIAFSRYGVNTSIPNLEKKLSSEHKSTITITPNVPQAEYLPIVVAATANPSAAKPIGFNLLSDKTRADAIHTARNTGKPVITPTVKLMPSGRDGIIMVLPVYTEDNQLYGFISAAYFIDTLVRNALGKEVPVVKANIVDSIRNKEIYTSYADVKGKSITRSDKIEVGGREWIITYEASANNYHINTSSLVHLVPFIGAFVIISTVYTAKLILNIVGKPPSYS